MSKITVKADDNVKPGMHTLTQLGVRMPNGRERWVEDLSLNSQRITVPGVVKYFPGSGDRNVHIVLDGGATDEFNVSLEEANRLYRRDVRQREIDPDAKIGELVAISRVITVIVGETLGISIPKVSIISEEL